MNTKEKLNEFRKIISRLGHLEIISEKHFRILTKYPEKLESLFRQIEAHHTSGCEPSFSIQLKNPAIYAGHTSYEAVIVQTNHQLPPEEYSKAYYHFLTSSISAAKKQHKP